MVSTKGATSTAKDAHPNASPRPGEPDLHVRFCCGPVIFDYLACKTAVDNLVSHWANSHNPQVTLCVMSDHTAQPSRLPCEATWLTH
ncbi:hypothetical protein NG2371_03412 [Nocardia gamkensis]|nr:hypothetical protein [Nocardia gamkensis]